MIRYSCELRIELVEAHQHCTIENCEDLSKYYKRLTKFSYK